MESTEVSGLLLVMHIMNEHSNTATTSLAFITTLTRCTPFILTLLRKHVLQTFVVLNISHLGMGGVVDRCSSTVVHECTMVFVIR